MIRIILLLIQFGFIGYAFFIFGKEAYKYYIAHKWFKKSKFIRDIIIEDRKHLYENNANLQMYINYPWYQTYLIKWIELSIGIDEFRRFTDYKKNYPKYIEFHQWYLQKCEDNGITEVTGRWRRDNRDNRLDELLGLN